MVGGDKDWDSGVNRAVGTTELCYGQRSIINRGELITSVMRQCV